MTALLPLAAEGALDSRVQIVAVVVTALMLGVVLELVRRRRLVERYALLWMTVAVVLLVLAIWTDLLSGAADLVGIDVPSNGLFLAAFGVAFLLLLHFSVATSRLGEESKILAQEVARLDQELRELRAAGSNGTGQPAARSSTRTTDQ
ncbi:MAG: DUF2304 domain-containing protein [Solirubrobacterales bacterium]